jgi:hypothetical protein
VAGDKLKQHRWIGQEDHAGTVFASWPLKKPVGSTAIRPRDLAGELFKDKKLLFLRTWYAYPMLV